MKTPNYVLSQDYSFMEGTETVTIKAGTFIRPVDSAYVPKHLLEDERYKHFNKETDSFCYWRKGFTLIPKKLVREV